MIKQSNYEDIKWSWQVELTQSEAIINHWLHETTFPKLLPTLVRAEDQADSSLCRGDLGQKKKESLCFFVLLRSNCRGHVAGRTPRFEVRSQVLSAVQGWAHPQPSSGSTCSSNTTWNKQQKKKKKHGGGGGERLNID